MGQGEREGEGLRSSSSFFFGGLDMDRLPNWNWCSNSSAAVSSSMEGATGRSNLRRTLRARARACPIHAGVHRC